MKEYTLIDTCLRNWNEQNKKLITLVESLSKTQIESEIAPQKNSGKYLIGHLAAINNNLFPLLGLGENPQPELDNIFIRNADGAVEHYYSVDELKDFLFTSIATFEERSNQLTTADWLDRHMSISEEEFKAQPHRNKINVLINRTLHLAHHLGQLSLLK